jgi:hypothetical protein
MAHPNGGKGNWLNPSHSFEDAYKFVGISGLRFFSTTGEAILARQGTTKDGSIPTIVFEGARNRHGSACKVCWGYSIDCCQSRVGHCAKKLDDAILEGARPEQHCHDQDGAGLTGKGIQTEQHKNDARSLDEEKSTLLSYFSPETVSEFMRRSNFWAKKNRNNYPFKIHEAVKALYKWIDCPCDDNCECKKYQCKKHLVRKEGFDFNDLNGCFLNCYVDSKAQKAVRSGRKSGRGKGVAEATTEIQKNWQSLNSVSVKKHLLCTNWCEAPYDSIARSFRPGPGTIYRAKWLSILCFDIFTAYDTTSVTLLNRDFGNPSTYLEMMDRIRLDIMSHLDKSGKTLDDLRGYDNPSEFFPKIPGDSPRPLGNIIDKLYLTL